MGDTTTTRGRQALGARRIRATIAVLAVVSVVAPAAEAGGPGRWTPVTEGGGPSEQVGAARTPDGVLHVGWRHVGDGGEDVLDTPIAPNGRFGATVPISAGWRTVGTPDLATAADGSLRAFWGGIHSLVTGDPNNHGSTATAPAAGGPWSAPEPILNGFFGYAGASGTVAPDGTPWVAYAVTGGLFVHRGADPATPDTYLANSTAAGQCCAGNADLAADAKSGAVYVAWGSGWSEQPGLRVMALDPATGAAAGPAVSPPRALAPWAGGMSGSAVDQRVAITGRPGRAGVYVAYLSGYPNSGRVMLWKVGAASALVVAEGRERLRFAGITADPEGRIWVVWTKQGNEYTVFARRSNAAVTRLGPPIEIASPVKGQWMWNLQAHAQQSLVDLLGSATAGPGGKQVTYHTQIRARFEVRAAPAAPKLHRPLQITFTATDAGTPLKGATVRFNGARKKTNAKGKATFALASQSKARTLTARATATGYDDVQLAIRVG